MYIPDLIESPLFVIGVLLVFGFLLGKLITVIRLPEISGFIIMGLVLSESVTGVVNHEMGERLRMVTEIALGIIALTIGGEFAWSKLKRLGTNIMVLTFMQLFVTFALVSVAMLLIGRVPLPFALLMGAVASATAPAATVAIVQGLRAKGEFIDYLYGIVALDDAGAVILFGIVMAIAAGIVGAGEAISQGMVILASFGEIAFSIVAGGVVGFLIHIVAVKQHNHDGILITTFGLLLLSVAVANVFHLSPLLTNMTAGAVLINISNTNHRIFRALQPISPPIYLLFFIIAGTELQPHIFLRPEVLLLGMLYILARAIGKYGGLFVGGALIHAPTRTRNWLGVCLLPQAGVALGLVLVIQGSPLVANAGSEVAAIIGTLVNVVLMSVFVNELIGPPLSRIAIIHGTRGT